MNLDQRRILKLIEQIRDYTEAISIRQKEVERIRKTIECDHPIDYRGSYKWEYDNGYGRQEWKIGHWCEICGSKDPWQVWGEV